MTRYWFGDSDDWAINASGKPTSAVRKGYTAEIGGDQHVDLLIGGTTPADSVPMPGGQPVRYQGPDGVLAMWVSDNGGPRVLVQSTDIPQLVLDAAATTTANRTAVQAVVATTDGLVTAVLNNISSTFRALMLFLFGKTLTPEQYGAVGDGVADDTTAVNNCFTAANVKVRSGLASTIKQPGATVSLSGTYKLASIAAPIDIKCNVKDHGAAFIVPDTYAGIAGRIGAPASGDYAQNFKMDLPDLLKSNSASIVAGSVGWQVINVGNSKLKFARTAYFETGIHFTGLGQGTAYNEINIGWVSYSKVSLSLKPGAAGWCNQNTFVGGGVQQSPGAFGGGLRRAGWKHLELDGNVSAGGFPIDGNTFVGVSFEGDVSQYTVTLKEAQNNKWIGVRHEVGTTATAVTMTASSADIACTAHGLSAGDQVMLNSTAQPGGMVNGARYFVIAAGLTANVFRVSRKKAGTAITFTSTGTAVTFVRPHRIYLDGTASITHNVWHDPMAYPAFLELMDPSFIGTGNTVESATSKVYDGNSATDAPLVRGRNAGGTKRPIFAAYPPATYPDNDPNGWTAALSDLGLILQIGGVELGRIYANANTGALTWAALGGTAFDLATCVRSAALDTTVSALSLAANTTTTATFTLAGVAVNDYVIPQPSGVVPAGVTIAYARVSAANTIVVGFANLTGSPISLTLSMEFMVFKRFL